MYNVYHGVYTIYTIHAAAVCVVELSYYMNTYSVYTAQYLGL